MTQAARTSIQEWWQREIDEREAAIKLPALHERFLLRNGQQFFPRRRIGRRAEPHACFANAYRFVASHPKATYVEGKVFTKSGFPLPHAWVTITGTDAMDPTLDARDHIYWGVKFTKEQVEKYTSEANGLLGGAVNTGLYADIDPELMKFVSLWPRHRLGLRPATMPL